MMMIMGERCLHLLHVFVVLLVLYIKPAFGLINSGVGDANIRCIENEREALLKFKKGLVDDYGHLSSWGSEDVKKDCCKWRGITCSNQTGHVVMLDLHVTPPYYLVGAYEPLRGKISPSLLELHHLNYLNLSYNDFGGSHIPMFIGHLTKLRYLDLKSANFRGAIPYQLGNLTNLQYLDLGYNWDILNVENLEWLTHLSSLKHLDMTNANLSKAIDWFQAINMLPSLLELHLSSCQLSDVVPPSLSFVNSSTSLAILDLGANYLNLTSSIYNWLFNFSGNLVDVDLSFNNLRSIPDVFQNMKSLTHLSLSSNQLEGSIPKSFGNISTLQTLKLDDNQLQGSILDTFQNMKSLTELDLSDNQLQGSIPDTFQNMKSLTCLSLSGNQLEGSIPKSFGNICNLQTLYLHRNNFTEELPKFVQNLLSGCTENSLETLMLDGNQLSGSLPDMTRFSSLRDLWLGQNRLTGFFNKKLKQPHAIVYLDLSENGIEGTLTEAHFLNLPRLEYLDLSHNSLSLDFSSHSVPPFQLDTIMLRACKLGPHFPKWLQTQKIFSYIDISSSGISDSIPKWFWDLSPRLIYLNLSSNQITGRLPNLSLKFSGKSAIDLSSNHFDGPLPLFPSNLTSLDLSKNMFSGSISSLCAITGGALTFIDLSNNLLSGGLPDCWMHFQKLVILDLANNNLSGKIPNSIGSLHLIQTLHLRNNSFFGELPLSLKNCKMVEILDLGENKLFGKIPAWIGESLSRLIVLSVRSNEFYGSIPGHLCLLNYIQILDLSQNNISGTIPQCLDNFTSMSQKGSLSEPISHSYDSYTSRAGGIYGSEYVDNAMVVLKGLQLEYRRNLRLVKIIDLSSNKITGEIPGKISSLIELISLNLSRNNLIGKITPMIGQLKQLESLDLSRNWLSGGVPVSFSNLNFLGYLDLSNNNLSGGIPTGTQLQSFNASSYMGNLNLCGPPLPNKCPGEETDQDPPIAGLSEGSNIQENEDGLITPWFYVSMGLGFILGFWGVCGTLLLNSSWRNAYFHFLNDMKDMLYVIIAVNMARLQRRLQG